MSDLKKKLAGMKASYTESQKTYESMFGGVKVPDGMYEAQLTSAKVVTSKSSKVQIKREHTILSGDLTGTIIYDYLQIETPLGFPFVRRWIDNMGYESPEDPTDLIEVVKAISEEAARCRIQVTHFGDNGVNVSIIELLDGDTEGVEKAVDAEVETTEEEQSTAFEVDRLIEKLQEFCTAQDIAFESDDNAEQLAERIAEYGYPEEQLSSEEIEMFTSANIAHCIQKPVPKPVKKEAVKVNKTTAVKTAVKETQKAAPAKKVIKKK